MSVKPEKHREIFKYFRNISWNISRNISGPKMSWNFTSLLLILPSQTSCYIRECIGDSRSEFNIILCTSKSESAVTSNKKLRCRYVEADYRKTRSIARPLCDSWASCWLDYLTSGEEDIERVSVLKEDILSTTFELTMLILSIYVTFNVTCFTVTSLITKSCQQRWPIHSCSFYKVVH